MIVVNYLAASALFGLGLYSVLTKRNLVKMVMGLSLMEASTYIMLLSFGYRSGSTAPVLLSPPGKLSPTQLAKGNVADPMLQNVCLTAIVIGVAVTGVFLAVTVRIAQHYRSIDSRDIREMHG